MSAWKPIGRLPLEVTIRPATAEDCEMLGALMSEGDAYHLEHLPHLFRQAPARDRKYILSLLGNEAMAVILAEVHGQTVGFAHVIIRESPPHPLLVPRRYAAIETIGVSRAFRRQGVGQALMARAEAWARTQGVCEIELNVYEFNAGAVAFYQRLGYATHSRKMSKRLE